MGFHGALVWMEALSRPRREEASSEWAGTGRASTATGLLAGGLLNLQAQSAFSLATLLSLTSLWEFPYWAGGLRTAPG